MKKSLLFNIAFALANPLEFMKRYPVKPQFAFRDEQSRNNFEAACMGLPSPRNFPMRTITVIAGDPGTGKSLLARIIAEELGAHEPYQIVAGPESIQRYLDSAIIHKSKVVIIENVSGKFLRSNHDYLCRMATATSHSIRKLFSHKIETYIHTPWVIMTMNGSGQLPADLDRRSRIIELTAPPEIISANVPSSGKTKLAKLATAAA
jgi:DNA polymerase III delta prime subunit